jgi:hypothetical protein
MGEIAEGMLDGTFCQVCGVWMGDFDAPGYPRSCAGCGGPAAAHERSQSRRSRKRRKTAARSRRRVSEAADFLADQGFLQMANPWHFQLRLPGCPALDYWPSRNKWCVRSVVYRGDRDALRLFIATLSLAAKVEAP